MGADDIDVVEAADDAVVCGQRDTSDAADGDTVQVVACIIIFFDGAVLDAAAVENGADGTCSVGTDDGFDSDV